MSNREFRQAIDELTGGSSRTPSFERVVNHRPPKRRLRRAPVMLAALAVLATTVSIQPWGGSEQIHPDWSFTETDWLAEPSTTAWLRTIPSFETIPLGGIDYADNAYEFDIGGGS